MARALQLSGGVAVYLLGDALFRAALHLRRAPWRLGAAAVALAASPLGANVWAAAQIAALVIILAGTLALEHSGARGVALRR